MGDYIISCCSTADLTAEHFNERDIKYLCFHYELDGKPYLDDLLWSSVFVTLMAKKYRFMQFELDMVFDTH